MSSNHVFSRRWSSTLLVGLVLAIMTSGVLLWLFPETSSIIAYLSDKTLEPDTIFDDKQRINPKEYEIFNSTQIALIKSHFVLNAALARADISQLDAVVKEEPDALAWLSENLNVTFRGEGEIIEVRFDGEEDPDEIVKLVDAVIAAYINEVVFNERARYRVTRESLKTLHKQLLAELAEEMEKFETLSKELGSAGSATTSAMLSMLGNEVRMIQKVIIEKKAELLDIEVMKELAIQQARSPSALEAAIQEEIARDPKFQSLQQEQQAATQQMTRLKADTSPKNSPEVKQLQEHLRTLDRQIQEYRISTETELRKRFKGAPNDYLAQVMREYMLRSDAAKKDLADLDDQYTEKMEEVRHKGETSGPLAILESQIAQLQEVEKTLDMQLRSWDVQDQAGSERIRIMQPATAFKNINKLERYTIAFIGGFATLCLTCLGSVLISHRWHRQSFGVDVATE